MIVCAASAPHIPNTYAAVRVVQSNHFRAVLANFRTGLFQ
jgi:hypothetical protein